MTQRPSDDPSSESDPAAASMRVRDRFIVALSAATQPLEDPQEVMQVTARLLAEQLGADRCAYAVVEDERIFDITGDYHRGVPSIVGRWPVAAFGPECVRCMLAGEPYVVADSALHPAIDATSRAAYDATAIRAVVCVPLHKHGKFSAAMAVHQASPRVWTADEIWLIGFVVARCWETLERARVTRTLRESEAQLQFSRRDVARDVSARAAAEQALARSRSRLDYAVRLSGVGFWYCDLPFDYLDWDERVKDHFFVPHDTRVTIALFYARIHPDDREPTRSAIDASIASRESYDVVYRTVHPETGALKWIRALGGTRYGSDGTPVHFDGVTVDVSAERRQQEQLSALNAQLRSEERRKDEFLATLAHELRNPLAPMRTGLGVLRASTDPEQIARVHTMMERQLGHMVHLVDDLLDLSRITEGKITLQLERVELQALLRNVLEATQPAIDKARHSLRLQLPEEPLWLDVDPTRLTQMITNLLNNAVKYTPVGGRITIAATVAEQTLSLRVTDNGVGIPGDMLARVFETFTQVGASLERAEGGLGIGLTLVRRLVELHGGKVYAASEGKNRGSTFTLELPVAHAPSAVVAERASAGEQQRALRVLVVDDNLDGAESLAMMLELEGHTPRVANSGAEALELAASFLPQVAFLDIGMPGMNGYELAQQLRKDARLGRCYLIALTGWGSEDDRRRAKQAGFDHHLVKPVDMDRMLGLLAELGRRTR